MLTEAAKTPKALINDCAAFCVFSHEIILMFTFIFPRDAPMSFSVESDCKITELLDTFIP